MLIVGDIHSYLLFHSQCFFIISENRVPLKKPNLESAFPIQICTLTQHVLGLGISHPQKLGVLE